MIGVGKEDQAGKLPFVPYHTECKYDQVFTTGYNGPHPLSSFFSFLWETWRFSPFPYSCFLLPISLFLFSTPVQIHQRPASWLLLTQHQWGLRKHHLTPVTGRYLSSCSVLSPAGRSPECEFHRELLGCHCFKQSWLTELGTPCV